MITLGPLDYLKDCRVLIFVSSRDSLDRLGDGSLWPSPSPVGHLSKVTMSRDEREMGTLETRPTVGHLSKVTMSRDEREMGTLETRPTVGHLSKVTMSRDEREMGTLETRPTGRCRQHVAVSTMLTPGLARIAPGK